MRATARDAPIRGHGASLRAAAPVRTARPAHGARGAVLALALGLGAGFAPAACGAPSARDDAPRTPLAPLRTPDPGLPVARSRPAAAATPYAALCARCHGPAGRGDGALAAALDPPPPDFHSPAGRHAPARAFRAIGRGVTGTSMKRFDHVLPPEARWDMTFLTWSWGDPPGARAAGARRFARDCASCHGAAGDRLAEARLDDPRVAGRSATETAARLAAAHPAAWRAADAAARAALVAHLYTFLYEPMPDPPPDPTVRAPAPVR